MMVMLMVMVIMSMLKGDKLFLGDNGRHDDDDEDKMSNKSSRRCHQVVVGSNKGSQPQGQQRHI